MFWGVLSLLLVFVQSLNAEDLTYKEATFILRSFNSGRRLLWSTYMIELSWSNKLAKMASKYADELNAAGKSDFDAPVGYSKVLGIGRLGDMDYLNSFLGLWRSEGVKFRTNLKYCLKELKCAPHYRRTIVPDSQKVGCGKSYTYSSHLPIVVCLFSPGVNDESVPLYKSGKPCTSCPAEFSKCRNPANLCQRANSPDVPESEIDPSTIDVAPINSGSGTSGSGASGSGASGSGTSGSGTSGSGTSGSGASSSGTSGSGASGSGAAGSGTSGSGTSGSGASGSGASGSGSGSTFIGIDPPSIDIGGASGSASSSINVNSGDSSQVIKNKHKKYTKNFADYDDDEIFFGDDDDDNDDNWRGKYRKSGCLGK